jgi:hypothetical protein
MFIFKLFIATHDKDTILMCDGWIGKQVVDV